MNEWGRLAGETFPGWLAPESGLRWLDVANAVKGRVSD
jgi:hypothetical protein